MRWIEVSPEVWDRMVPGKVFMVDGRRVRVVQRASPNKDSRGRSSGRQMVQVKDCE